MTDRYTKAIEQLGSDKLDVRLGGIYALEQIVRDSARDHPTVMEVLTAFIREYSRKPSVPSAVDDQGVAGSGRGVRTDVQAAITVIGRRNPAYDPKDREIERAGAAVHVSYPLNLTGANLVGAVLGTANLPNANLTGANLISAILAGADLTQRELYRCGPHQRGPRHLGRGRRHQRELHQRGLATGGASSSGLAARSRLCPFEAGRH